MQSYYQIIVPHWTYLSRPWQLLPSINSNFTQSNTFSTNVERNQQILNNSFSNNHIHQSPSIQVINKKRRRKNSGKYKNKHRNSTYSHANVLTSSKEKEKDNLIKIKTTSNENMKVALFNATLLEIKTKEY